MLPVHDYDGEGRWSRDAIQRRYDELARRFRVIERIDLLPKEHVSAAGRWIYPMMERVIEGIERGDLACAEIGVEFIKEDQSFPFGKTLKSNTARALRRAPLTEGQKELIRKRVVEMMLVGRIPQEFGEYARLARKVGLGKWLLKLDGKVNLKNPLVRRYYDYFCRFAK